MTYDELPLITIDATRGSEWQKVVLQNITVDGNLIDLTAVCPAVQFKSVNSFFAPVDFELTVENGGMVITPNSITLVFGSDRTKYPKRKYYGDLLMKVLDKDATILRFEFILDGVITRRNCNGC